MIEPPAIAAIRRFFVIVGEGAPPNTAELARALDELVVAVHDAPEGDPADEEVAAPAHDYWGEHARQTARFPELGYYAVVWPFSPEEVLTGDAHDDLADIIADLSEVIWRYEIVSADDAYWHLHFQFLHHWGVHLRELSLYLHFLLRDSD